MHLFARIEFKKYSAPDYKWKIKFYNKTEEREKNLSKK